MRNSERKRINAKLVAIFLLLSMPGLVSGRSQGQTSAPQDTPTSPDAASHQAEPSSGSPTPIAKLIDEAEHNNPQIAAARHAWKAATLVPSQASAPPDPQFTVQQFAVGSPRPFAGFTNSDFAYVSLGVSQDLPYPGKLRLRGEIAQHDAAAERERFGAVRRSVVEQLKTAYFKLAYEHQELQILDRDGKLLDQVAKIADARYRVGQGNQQDVLKAQLEQTKLLRETAMHHQEHASLQAQLKQLLNRSPSQPDITPEPLTETPLSYTVDELLGMVRAQNPEIRGQEEIVLRQSLQVELAGKDFYPDFTVESGRPDTASGDYNNPAVKVRVERTDGKSEVAIAQTAQARSLSAERPDELTAAIESEVLAHMGDAPLADDVTLLVVSRNAT